MILLTQADAPTYLSVGEELAIIRFYLLRIGRLVRAFQLPSLIESTAMTLMKRFYLRNSCMQFHPKLIMCVAQLTQAHKHLPRLESRKLPTALVAVLCPGKRERGRQATASTAVGSAWRRDRKYYQRSRVWYGAEPRL